MGKYKPFVLLGPGDAIKEELEFYGWRQEDLAEIMGMSAKHVNQLVKNRAPVTFDTARLLSRVFKQSVQFWINLDTNYRLQLEENALNEETAAKALIFRYMPVLEMHKKGWLNKNDNLIAQVKAFWNIRNLQFDFMKENVPAYFRKSQTKKGFNPYYALTWIQKARIEATKQAEINHYNEEGLYQLADEIPAFTRKGKGITEFIDALNRNGVVFLHLPHLSQTYTDGAVLWLDENPVIVYTARFDRNDNFWFTITHEIAHILLHDDLEHNEFIDSFDLMDVSEKSENEADKFARKHLKSDDIVRFFADSITCSKKKVMKCAEIFGIHPAVVVGCLQHEGKISFRSCNEFKESVRIHLPDPPGSNA